MQENIGDEAGAGRAYGNLVNVYHSLDDYGKAIKYDENHSKIAKEIGDGVGEGRVYGNLNTTQQSLGD